MPSLPNLDLHKSGDGVSVNQPDPENKDVPLISYLFMIYGEIGEICLYNMTHKKTQTYRVLLDENYYVINLIK